ncbi:MAG TPA: hypothetical protein VFI02_19195 [Armatimonadota bacterium]|nr:hypothetical protein [Armatimonadota bacterium]
MGDRLVLFLRLDVTGRFQPDTVHEASDQLPTLLRCSLFQNLREAPLVLPHDIHVEFRDRRNLVCTRLSRHQFLSASRKLIQSGIRPSNVLQTLLNRSSHVVYLGIQFCDLATEINSITNALPLHLPQSLVDLAGKPLRVCPLPEPIEDTAKHGLLDHLLVNVYSRTATERTAVLRTAANVVVALAALAICARETGHVRAAPLALEESA